MKFIALAQPAGSNVEPFDDDPLEPEPRADPFVFITFIRVLTTEM